VATTIKKHANMIAGCNSLQLYLLDFIKNKMLDDYLSQCSGEVNIPLPSKQKHTELKNKASSK
jgi:hypothetical protein